MEGIAISSTGRSNSSSSLDVARPLPCSSLLDCSPPDSSSLDELRADGRRPVRLICRSRYFGRGVIMLEAGA